MNRDQGWSEQEHRVREPFGLAIHGVHPAGYEIDGALRFRRLHFPKVQHDRAQPLDRLHGGHRILEARSLAMHCLMAQKIERDSALLDRVRQTLETWRARYTNEGDPVPRALAEWQRSLGEPWPVIAALMTDAGERGTRLRQSTPFAGVLTPEERERVYAAFRS